MDSMGHYWTGDNVFSNGFPAPDLDEEPQLNAPGADDIDPQMFADIAKKLGIKL
ncbi:hypothetical protein [Larkinella rosea]|uniref:hypothetical protein n=1 Tax=Larkinella rosea TaxID=2025312 RepID=UPI00163B1612|nr:hypothetical protein [Larkinella rosea]